MQLTAGQIVDGRFEVESLVGEGGLAEVYRVRHRTLGRVMALKLLTWRKKSLQDRLVLEGRIQAQLDHPNIVSVIDLVQHDGQVGLLMEYVDADNLHDHIQRVGATPQAEALELLAPILGAVDAAHRVGITHRDIKPGNIMLARNGSGVVPKVTDFGIAKVVQEVSSDVGFSTRAGSAMGTPGYLAPEQVRDASTIDARADVFALGTIAYEVLSGVPAFADDEGYIETTATATQEPVPIEDRVEVTPCVAEAIREALTKELDDRTPSVAALAEKLLHSRPDLLAAFHSQQVKPIDLSLPPTDDTGSFPVSPPPSSQPTAPVVQRQSSPTIASMHPTTSDTIAPVAAAGGWIAAGVLGTLLVLTLVGAGAFLALRGGRYSDSATAAATRIQPELPRPATAPAVPAAPPPEAAEMVQPTAGPTAEAPPQPDRTRPAPKATAAPPPAPEPAPAGGTDEAREPAPAPVVMEVPAVEAATAPAQEPAPEPAPEPVSYPAVGGAWSGKAGGQRMTIALAAKGASLSGTLTLYAGTQVRTESIQGSIEPDGNLSFTAGDLTFSGRAVGSALSGMYMRQGAKKTLKWSAAQ